MRKALIVAYAYPPIGGSGVQRTLKFSKYLLDYGWLPIVVCGDDGQVFEDGIDATLKTEIPSDIQVYRRPFISAYGLRRRLKRILSYNDRSNASEIENVQKQLTTVEIDSDNGREHSQASPLGRRIMGAAGWLFEPIEKPLIDSALYWALSIIPLCRKLIIEQEIDVLFTTSFPYSDHIVGLALERLTSVRWVADFRDPWTRNACFQHRGVRRRADEFVERQVLNRAHYIIGATPTYTDDFRSLAPQRRPESFVTIPNGYDEQDFSGLAEGHPSAPWPTPAKNRHITLIHMGYVFPESAIPFLAAIAALGDDAQKFRLIFVGGLAVPDMKWLKNNPIKAELVFLDRVTHAEAIAGMQAADFLLLLINDGPGWTGHYPGKLFEYLRSGTPVLLSGPDGAAAALLQEAGVGVLFPVDDQECSVVMLESLLADPAAFRECNFLPRPEIICRYERRSQARQLARLFDELVAST